MLLFAVMIGRESRIVCIFKYVRVSGPVTMPPTDHAPWLFVAVVWQVG